MAASSHCDEERRIRSSKRGVQEKKLADPATAFGLKRGLPQPPMGRKEFL
jgi:hypothetical protein